MSAFAILRIPNEEHTRRVLGTRWALRIVPPCEGVRPCHRDATLAETTSAPGEASQPGPQSGIAEPFLSTKDSPHAPS